MNYKWREEKDKEEEKTYKKMMIKNEWRQEARRLIYQTIVIKGYKLKHISTKYTNDVFYIIFFIHIQIEWFIKFFFMNIKLRRRTY